MHNNLLSVTRKIENLIKKDAIPEFRWEHIERVWELCQSIGRLYDKINYDVLYISTLLHDIGTYINHRPSEYDKLQSWDHKKYASEFADKVLSENDISGIIIDKIKDTINNHSPENTPTHLEGIILHDADLLDSLGIIGVCRVLYKVGDVVDMRFNNLNDALEWLDKRHESVNKYLITDKAKELFQIKKNNFLEFKKLLSNEMIM